MKNTTRTENTNTIIGRRGYSIPPGITVRVNPGALSRHLINLRRRHGAALPVYIRPNNNASMKRAGIKRRALKAEVQQASFNFEDIVAKTDGCCAYCGGDLHTVKNGKRHIDHYYPLDLVRKAKKPARRKRLARIVGAESNLILSCGHCNSSKGNKLPLNFIWGVRK